MQRPDVLVLGAGGTIGAAWMSGVLAAIAHATGVDFTAVEHIVGTSAGSMVAADLLAGVEPRAPADPGAEAQQAATAPASRAARLGGSVATAVGTPLAPLALSLARPIGTLARAAALARIESPTAALDDLRERIDQHGLRFDGQLRIVCVDRQSGRRVVFGAPGAPAASVAEAVQASCSVPWVNQPVRIGEREYVDGAVWSPVNMDVAPALRETHVLCLAPMGGPLGSQARSRGVRAATATAIRLETLALRRRGVQLTLMVPEPLDAREHARVTGWRQGRALARGH
jgi:NTE family protein